MKRKMLLLLLLFFAVACGDDTNTGDGTNNGNQAVDYCDFTNVTSSTATDDQICGKKCCELCNGAYDDSYYNSSYPNKTPTERCMFECSRSLITEFEEWTGPPTTKCKTAVREKIWCWSDLSCQEQGEWQNLNKCTRPCAQAYETYQQYCRCDDTSCSEWDVGGAAACSPANAPVITSFSVSSSCVLLGDSVTLSWVTEKAESCTLTGPISSTNRQETKNVSPNDSITFTSQMDKWNCLGSSWQIICKNQNGDTTSDIANGCIGSCMSNQINGGSGGSSNTACSDCLDNCAGLSSCCTGSGCLCQDECTVSDCTPPKFRCCDDYGFCMCVDDCPF